MAEVNELEGKKIALIGLGISQVDFAIGLQNGRQWDEVWCINSAAATYPCDRIFMMDPASRFFDTNDAGKQTSVMCRVLQETETPVYTCELDSRIKNLIMYPLEAVRREHIILLLAVVIHLSWLCTQVQQPWVLAPQHLSQQVKLQAPITPPVVQH
jgi:hypothetical protein